MLDSKSLEVTCGAWIFRKPVYQSLSFVQLFGRILSTSNSPFENVPITVKTLVKVDLNLRYCLSANLLDEVPVSDEIECHYVRDTRVLSSDGN